MTFEEWVAQQPWELEAGCGRYEDMRVAYRAGTEDVETLRDEFAKAALMGPLADSDTHNVEEDTEWSYRYADAMLKAREVKDE